MVQCMPSGRNKLIGFGNVSDSVVQFAGFWMQIDGQEAKLNWVVMLSKIDVAILATVIH